MTHTGDNTLNSFGYDNNTLDMHKLRHQELIERANREREAAEARNTDLPLRRRKTRINNDSKR